MTLWSSTGLSSWCVRLMGKISITPDKLAAKLQQELTIYHEDVNEKIRKATRESMAELVRKTRATAPEKSGNFKKSISGDFKGLKKGNRKITAIWFVKKPHYRLTHLLVHGHALKNGGRTKADPFLANALSEVLPKYEEAVKEAIKK